MNKVEEIWKDVPGYEGMYKASNLGRIKSFKRYHKGVILSQYISGTQYLSLRLSKHEKQKIYGVHQIIAMTFLGHKPNGHKLVVNHINLNKKDNRLDNLEIITQRENVNHRCKIGSSKYNGVFWHKGGSKWCASIYVNKKQIYLGLFVNEYDAHLAYQNKLKEINSKHI